MQRYDDCIYAAHTKQIPIGQIENVEYILCGILSSNPRPSVSFVHKVFNHIYAAAAAFVRGELCEQSRCVLFANVYVEELFGSQYWNVRPILCQPICTAIANTRRIFAVRLQNKQTLVMRVSEQEPCKS